MLEYLCDCVNWTNTGALVYQPVKALLTILTFHVISHFCFYKCKNKFAGL